jgi:hypothetical protein
MKKLMRRAANLEAYGRVTLFGTSRPRSSPAAASPVRWGYHRPKREHMVIYALLIVAVIGLAVAVVFN